MRFLEWALVALVCGFFGLIGVRLGQKACDTVEQVEWKAVASKTKEAAGTASSKVASATKAATAKVKAQALKIKPVKLRPRNGDGTLPS